MLARLLRERTTVCQTWIAKKLSMGSAATVFQQLRRFNQRSLSAPDLHQWRLLSKIDDCPHRPIHRGQTCVWFSPRKPKTLSSRFYTPSVVPVNLGAGDSVVEFAAS
jgi:hypothetical protein